MVSALFIGASCGGIDVDPEAKQKGLIGFLNNFLKRHHYLSIPVDDRFSEKAFDTYIKKLDSKKHFLLKKDVKVLSYYRHRIDDQINYKSLKFLKASDKLIQKRMEEAKSFLSILDSPFDFTIDEEISLDDDDMDYVETKKELANRWRKEFKANALIRMLELDRDQSLRSNVEGSRLEFEELETKARKEILKNYQSYFRKLLQRSLKNRFNDYVNAILENYDPHTVYLPPQEKKDFDIAMSGKLEGIGARLQEKDRYIEISEVVPGGPSWRQGELEKGDMIIKVAQGDGAPVDVMDMPIQDAVQLIRGRRGTEVRLTVKKTSGNTQVISIIRDVVILEETLVKSSVIETSEGERFGYLFLPRFYIDFQNPGNSSCANDVRRHLLKLKDQKVSGIVFDLRNNSGGSLSEVVKIMGFFIEKGPVVQVRSKNRRDVLFDTDKTIVYEGPLLVLVNSVSASASEILAAAVQDYGRGLVIGTGKTYGKGTVQNLFDISQYLPAWRGGLGSVKLTFQKFYRIIGDSTQLKGVAPDIYLPDLYSGIIKGEEGMENAMEWDEIEGVKYNAWESVYAREEVIADTQKRIEINPLFQAIQRHVQYLEEKKEDKKQSLKWSLYKRQQEELKKRQNHLEGLQRKTELRFYPTNELSKEEKINAQKLENQKSWLKRLQKDIYLEEASKILSYIQSSINVSSQSLK